MADGAETTTSPPRAGVVMCEHCKATQTPLWRRGPNNIQLCNACGLHWNIHKVMRSLTPRARGRPPRDESPLKKSPPPAKERTPRTPRARKELSPSPEPSPSNRSGRASRVDYVKMLYRGKAIRTAPPPLKQSTPPAAEKVADAPVVERAPSAPVLEPVIEIFQSKQKISLDPEVVVEKREEPRSLSRRKAGVAVQVDALAHAPLSPGEMYYEGAILREGMFITVRGTDGREYYTKILSLFVDDQQKKMAEIEYLVPKPGRLHASAVRLRVLMPMDLQPSGTTASLPLEALYRVVYENRRSSSPPLDLERLETEEVAQRLVAMTPA